MMKASIRCICAMTYSPHLVSRNFPVVKTTGLEDSRLSASIEAKVRVVFLVRTWCSSVLPTVSPEVLADIALRPGELLGRLMASLAATELPSSSSDSMLCLSRLDRVARDLLRPGELCLAALSGDLRCRSSEATPNRLPGEHERPAQAAG